MKKLKVNFRKWRSGTDSNNKLGIGDTCLWNREGYGCCLGHITPQLNPKITMEDMIDEAVPSHLGVDIEGLTKRSFEDSILCTALSSNAVFINDHEDITVEERMKRLIALFFDHDYELIFTYIPKKYK